MRVAVLCLGLLLTTCLPPAQAEWTSEAPVNLRVGIAIEKQVEIRCDGPVEAILDGRSTESVTLQPGVYTVSLVDSPDFLRAAPLVAGVISAPPQELIAVGAPPAPTGDWKVDLVRTRSPSNADRAEQDARRNLRGNIRRFQEGGVFIVQAGPFPNEYIARQAMQKARGFGFPAQVVAPGAFEGYAAPVAAAPAAAGGPKRSLRLAPKGQPQRPSEPSGPVGEPLEEVRIPSSLPPPESIPDLEPLDLIPEESFEIEPLETIPPEELALEPMLEPEPEPVLEPIPEPETARLEPETGWRPAPDAGPQDYSQPERISAAPKRAPRGPQARPGGPPPPRERMNNQRGPQRPPEARAMTPPNAQRNGMRRPPFRQGPPPVPSARGTEPRRGPERVQPARPRPAPAPAPAPPPEESPKFAGPLEPTQPIEDRRPQPNVSRIPAPQEPMEQKRLPAELIPVRPPEPRGADSFASVPERTRPRFPNIIKSLPIIRRFWWQDPIETTRPAPRGPNYEQGLENALREPSLASRDGGEPPSVEVVTETGTGEIPSFEPKSALDSEVAMGAVPDIEPFVPESPIDSGQPDDLRGFIPAPPDPNEPATTVVEGPDPAPFPNSFDDEPSMEPFSEPETAMLPSERTDDPVVDIDPSLIPDSPGSVDLDAPLFLATEEGQSAAGGEAFTPDSGSSSAEPGTSGLTEKRAAGGGRPLVVPPTEPVTRAYVQVFDSSGKPLTDGASIIDLRPLTSSRLEYNENSYHGVFQAFAPSDEWMVLVNQVNLEDYVAGIVPEEIPPEAPLDVLKAQAVMSRCYALQLSQTGDYREYGFDVPGDANSEWPYYGRDKETPNIRLAVDETAGEVLIQENGELALPVYCFASGGYVADAQSIWGDSGEPVPTYLKGKPDYNPPEVEEYGIGPEGFSQDEKLVEKWLKDSPNTLDREAAGDYFRWKKTFSDNQLDGLVNAYWNNQVGHVEEMEVTQRAVSGHVTRMRIKGSLQTVEARDSDTIRDALKLDSSLIFIEKGWASDWTIYGGGLGHGVGLSQCGAIGLVKKLNANYLKVLRYYFEDLKLGRRDLVRSKTGA